MTGLTLGVFLAIAIFVAVVWLLRPARRVLKPAQSSVNRRLENFLPRHYRYFPQVRQAISSVDKEYLDRAAPPEVAQIAHRERCAVARQFLAGLRQDFSNLERLARMVAALSPVISSEQETERLVLGLKFRLLYAWVWLRLSTGRAPLDQIEHLTGLVGRLATRMEQAMAAVGALSAPGLDSNLSV
jgi:HAMP domain-containing protein